MKKSASLPDNYPTLLAGIRERVRTAQYDALKAVNRELVGLYWDIGRLIIDQQKGATWGKAVVEDCQKIFNWSFLVQVDFLPPTCGG